jgi:hypothetical protein
MSVLRSGEHDVPLACTFSCIEINFCSRLNTNLSLHARNRRVHPLRRLPKAPVCASECPLPTTIYESSRGSTGYTCVPVNSNKRTPGDPVPRHRVSRRRHSAASKTSTTDLQGRSTSLNVRVSDRRSAARSDRNVEATSASCVETNDLIIGVRD